MTQQKSMSGVAWAQLLLLALIWGGSFLSTRIALDEIGPFTAVLHRCFWAMLVLWAAVLLSGKAIPREPRVWGAFLVMGVLNNVLPFFFLAWGQLHIESGLMAYGAEATEENTPWEVDFGWAISRTKKDFRGREALFDDPGTPFFNVNTPEDLAHAEALLS